MVSLGPLLLNSFMNVLGPQKLRYTHTHTKWSTDPSLCLIDAVLEEEGPSAGSIIKHN